MVKNPPVNAGDTGSTSGSGRFPGGGNDKPLHYSCLRNPMDKRAWQVIVHGILQSRILECVAFPFLGDLPNPGIEPRYSALQADSLPTEPQGKPKNIGVGSLSLLQWIFPTQELNLGLLHCRWILYQLSYQGCHYRSRHNSENGPQGDKNKLTMELKINYT